MVDWNKPLKLEADGEQFDNFPTEMDPNEDGIICDGIAFNTDTVYIVRSGSDLIFNDLSAGSATLTELLATETVLNTITVTTTYTESGVNEIIFCNPGTDFTVTLPTATDGDKIYIKNIRTILPKNEVTIAGSGGATLDNQSTIGIRNSESVILLSDGTDWWIN